MKHVRLYQNTNLQIGSNVILDEYGYHHLVKVLRFPEGKDITLFNGDGMNYTATVVRVKKECVVDVHSCEQNLSESELIIHLIQGIAKGEKMDFLIQKAVELGVSKFTPVMSERCVVKLKGDKLYKRQMHWQKVIISAAEQSGRSVIPELCDTINFVEIFNSDITNGLVLHHRAETSLLDMQPVSEVTIIIGPEGGLTSSEIGMAIESKCNPIALGNRILRTETASLAAIANLQLLWGSQQN
ncbi:MAG: 16S rRNA (uracil(1498)-N(3))-methyltransferase [Candidatus Thioglobus sp.]|jgi:16S rRNA (uracil1498-N3)-methyltransferase